MNEDLIRKYADLMKELELTGIEIEENGTSIRLERNIKGSTDPIILADRSDSTPPARGQSPYDEVASPMIGVFYAAPAENAEPFVSVGDRVRKGDTLCIIEAMKLMNEVTAERDGVIHEICVKNGQTVEFGTVLFLMGD